MMREKVTTSCLARKTVPLVVPDVLLLCSSRATDGGQYRGPTMNGFSKDRIAKPGAGVVANSSWRAPWNNGI